MPLKAMTEVVLDALATKIIIVMRILSEANMIYMITKKILINNVYNLTVEIISFPSHAPIVVVLRLVNPFESWFCGVHLTE